MSGQQQLSQQLTRRLGNGFDERNLRNMRAEAVGKLCNRGGWR
jgi:hypothetical protein